MALKILTKLNLKNGRTLKLATFSSIAYTDNTIGERNHGELYLQSLGTNLCSGHAQPSTIRYDIATEEGAANYLEVGLLGDEFTSCQISLHDIDGIVESVGKNSGIGPFQREAMLGIAVDDETGQGALVLIIRAQDEWDAQYNTGKYMIESTGLRDGILDWLDGAGSDDDDPYDPTNPEPRPEPEPQPDPDPIPIPPLPNIGAVNTGFVKLYNPTIPQIQNLANFMWSDAFDLNSFKKLFGDPMGAILGLAMMPFNIPSVVSGPVTLGNVNTGVEMNICSNQFVEINCGSITMVPKWNAYLDYAPYTSIEIYLPFCGTHPLDTDEVMGKSIQVVYHIDVLNGSCIAYVKVGSSVLYEFSGQCSSMIPINGNDWAGAITAAIGSASVLGAMVATGGASTALTATQAIGTTAVTGASLAGNVMGAKPRIEKSGSLSGPAGALGVLKPYVIIKRPNQCVPGYQNKYIGYPAFKTVRLSSLTGFTIVEQIHLENVPATDAEKTEIIQKLMEGVII